VLKPQVRYHQSRSIVRWPVRHHNRIPVKVVSINLIEVARFQAGLPGDTTLLGLGLPT
jgi:hypothetical protein